MLWLIVSSSVNAAMFRDAASCELELGTLEEVQKGFEQACFSAGGQEIYGPLVDAVARTAAWLRARAERSDMRQQNESGKRFEGVSGALEVTLKPLLQLNRSCSGAHHHMYLGPR